MAKTRRLTEFDDEELYISPDGKRMMMVDQDGFTLVRLGEPYNPDYGTHVATLPEPEQPLEWLEKGDDDPEYKAPKRKLTNAYLPYDRLN